ncbi:MAG: glutamate--tRNA ligase [Proteobacteria bacterium]|nr:glutamate--tRNA ligase [Pseudomonadota bacterium]
MIKLRFAPSPTGLMHVGNARTALVNWLFAKKHGGQFILRFDDTDVARSRDEYAEAILQDMAWLGWTHDALFHQSKRLDLYRKAFEALKAAGRLYACYETPQELDFKRKRLLSLGQPPVYDRTALSLSDEDKARLEGEGRKPHWRFRLEHRAVTWQDLARGPLSYEGGALSDPILVREDGTFVYTFCSVVDDVDMNITHILRGNDHISNTAVQIQLLEALGADPSAIAFGHFPLLLGENGESLSKRLGSLSLQELRAQGLEPMAISSYLAHLGTRDEITPELALEPLIAHFDPTAFSANTPKFSPTDLERLSSKLVHKMPFDQVKERLASLGLSHMDEAFWLIARENLSKVEDIRDLWEICYGELSAQKREADAPYLLEALGCLPDGTWNEETWGQWTSTLKEATGRKGRELFLPLRWALTAQEHGPEMKKLLPLMGRDLVVKRLESAL